MNPRNKISAQMELNDTTISYEEQLLINYDTYLQDSLSFPISTKKHIDIFKGLEEDVEEDFEAEYDENDWEEEEPTYYYKKNDLEL